MAHYIFTFVLAVLDILLTVIMWNDIKELSKFIGH